MIEFAAGAACAFAFSWWFDYRRTGRLRAATDQAVDSAINAGAHERAAGQAAADAEGWAREAERHASQGRVVVGVDPASGPDHTVEAVYVDGRLVGTYSAGGVVAGGYAETYDHKGQAVDLSPPAPTVSSRL